MRRALIIAALACAPLAQGVAQSSRALNRQLEAIRTDLARYDTLSPFGEESDAIEPLGKRIIDAMLSAVKDPRVTAAGIKQHLGDGPMQFQASADDRVWLFSLDERTGGSFRSRINFGRFRLPDGSLLVTEDLARSEEEDDATSLSVGGFDAIHQLDDSAYFVMSGVRGCGACWAEDAWRLVLRPGGPLFQRIHGFDGWYSNLAAFDFDPVKKTLTYSYVHEDDANASDDHSYIWQRGTYRYLRGAFIEVEACTALVSERPFDPR